MYALIFVVLLFLVTLCLVVAVQPCKEWIPIRKKINQMVSRGMWVVVMVLVGYWSNDNRLRVWEKTDWIICHSDCKHLLQRLLSVVHQFFWAWVISPWLWALLSLSIREMFKKCQFSQDSLAFWSLDAAWIG